MSKKKKIIIITSSILAVIALAVIVAVSMGVKETKDIIQSDDYEVLKSTGVVFKGKSEIKDEQIIMKEPTYEVEKLHIKDGDEVKKDTILVTYVNNAIKEQIETVSRQKTSTQTKLDRANKEKSDNSKALKSAEERVDSLEKKYKNELEKERKRVQLSIQTNTSSDGESDVQSKQLQQPNISSALEGELAQARSEVQMLLSTQKGNDGAIVGLNDTIVELNDQINAFNDKLKKEVKADIDGIAYVNDNTSNNPSAPYIRIISKDSIIQASANEYDILKINVGKVMNLKVLSTGEQLTGEIIAVDNLPLQAKALTDTVYGFTVKPSKNIRIGFTVEMKEKVDTLDIPKEYIADIDGKLYVAFADGSEARYKKIEIEGKLDGEYYIVKEGILKEHDKIGLDPYNLFKLINDKNIEQGKDDKKDSSNEKLVKEVEKSGDKTK